ncbi:unnamed protein product [Sphagnum jensenii]|uniref:Uricase n=1 Tax=Sphagnum jensenii TaxID=128206 RepID=A0ABP1BI35_9BRYO
MADLKLEHQHGKARVRVARLWRGKRPGEADYLAEWNVSISLISRVLAAFTDGDNSNIVATDTMKNTVYAIAKECTDPLSLEDFGVRLGRHFLTTYPEIVTGAKVMLFEKPWERATVDGQPHNHGFKLGSEKHTVEVVVNSEGDAKVTSGVSELSLLKTTQSGFEGFLRDKYTLLPETRERMLASAIRAVWRCICYGGLCSYSSKPADYQKTYREVKDILVSTFFGPPREGIYSPSVQKTLYEMAQAVLSRFPEIESVYLNMPNIHFLPVNMPTPERLTCVFICFLVQFGDDVFIPTDEPHGSIEARLSRKPILISNL